MHRPDPHSYYDAAQPKARRLRLKLGVDFTTKRIAGEVVLEFGGAVSGPLDLDTKGLEIHTVQVPGHGPIPWELGEADAILGQRLRLEVPAGTQEVTITYRTGADAMALQWLDPEQTEGKVAPYLFSQCQQIHARTMVPCQDTPLARIAYQAEVTVPEGLTAVMSAGPDGDEATGDGRHLFRFTMPQPIPSYLLGPGVGRTRDGGSRRLGIRGRGEHDPQGRGTVRALPLGPLRHAGAAALLPLRRDGEPPHDLPHAHTAGGRPQPGGRGGPRTGPQLDRQPRHQRQHGALLAERGLHRMGRAQDPAHPPRR